MSRRRRPSEPVEHTLPEPSGTLLDAFAALVRHMSQPAVQTPPESRVLRRPRSARRLQRRASDNDTIEVPGRFGVSVLRGRVAESWREFNPETFCMPPHILINEEQVIWGRRWIVKTTSLGERHGLGVFACEDIVVPDPCPLDGVPLFPYCGSVYGTSEWNRILSQCPAWKVYQLDMDRYAGSTVRHSQIKIVDGDPIRSSNIAGYINSSLGTRPKRMKNIEWLQFDGPPLHPPYPMRANMAGHIMTSAIRTIRAGEELFTSYGWGCHSDNDSD